jgi:folate-binding protein YgfZ
VNDPRVSQTFREHYRALTSDAGWCDLGHRTQIELIGEDRVHLLHNLCTADIAGLKPGQGCEAFFTSPQGKTLALVCVFCHVDSLVVETVADQAQTLIAHMDRYVIREDVQLIDRSQGRRELLLSGGQVARRLAEMHIAVPPRPLDHAQVALAEARAWLRRVNITGDHSFLLSADVDQMEAAKQCLRASSMPECLGDALEAVRVECGWPVFGQDVTDGNLPQEVNRDDRAISFTKGCYLGQETVARIDSLGHVNRKLVQVQFLGSEVPAVGTRLRTAGQEVGQVTSSVYSPQLDSPLALAYLRRGHDAPGTPVESDAGDGQVVALLA